MQNQEGASNKQPFSLFYHSAEEEEEEEKEKETTKPTISYKSDSTRVVTNDNRFNELLNWSNLVLSAGFIIVIVIATTRQAMSIKTAEFIMNAN